MKKELNPVLMVAVIVVVIAVLVGGFMYYSAPRTPAGVKYTPGVPPWLEKGNNQAPAQGTPGGPPPGAPGAR